MVQYTLSIFPTEGVVMEKEKRRPYHLTPLGDSWGWRQRTLEIVGQTIGRVVFLPLMVIHNAIERLLSEIFR